jgi:hypothetical protein
MCPRPTLTLTVVAALLSAGCQATPTGTPSAPAAASSLPAPPSVAPSVPPPTTKAVPPTTKAALKAADGRKLKSCRDGTCEVIVKNGDSLPNAGGAGPAEVTVRGDEVTFQMTADDGFSSTMTGGPGNVHQLNDQVILIIAVEDGRALLRLRRQ